MKDLVLHKTVYFPKIVYHTILDEEICDEINSITRKEKHKWEKGLKNVKALTSGWNSSHYSVIQDLSSFVCLKILPSITDTSNWFCRDCWINAYAKGDSADAHNHIGTDMCAILLTTNTSKNCLKFIEHNLMEQVDEQKGLLIIFPPELNHLVEKVEDEERITVAFNFQYDKSNR